MNWQDYFKRHFLLIKKLKMKVKFDKYRIYKLTHTKRYSFSITLTTFDKRYNRSMLFSIGITILNWGVIILFER